MKCTCESADSINAQNIKILWLTLNIIFILKCIFYHMSVVFTPLISVAWQIVKFSIYCICDELKYRTEFVHALIMNLGTREIWVVSFMPHLLYCWGMCCKYPLNTKLCVLQRLSGCFGEDEDPLNLSEMRPQFLSCPSSPWCSHCVRCTTGDGTEY